MIPELKKNSLLIISVFSLLVFLFIILLSETVFMITNSSPELNYFFLQKAKHYAQTSEFEKSFKYLNWIIKLDINYNSKKRKSGLFPKNYQFNLSIPQTNPNFLNGYENIISKIDPGEIVNSKDNMVSKIFYELGIIASENNLSDLTQSLLQTAIYIQPELSFYHVELANYFLSMGDGDKASEVISNCLQLKDPHDHCKDYQENSLDNNITEKVGFLQQTVESFYKSAPIKSF